MNLAFKDIRKNLGRFVITTIGIGMLLMVVMGMAVFIADCWKTPRS